jgi:hypothetical protein
VARALTVEEQQRYPWASRIHDYTPVGRLRKVGLWAAVLALVCFLAGTIALALVAVDIRNGVDYTSGTLGLVTLWISGVLALGAFVIGVVGLVPALARGAAGPILWSLGAMLPALTAVVVVLVLNP